MRTNKSAVWLVLLGVLCPAAAGAASASAKGTNIVVDTADTGLISVNEKSEPEGEKPPVFYQDKDTSMGFNENGEPNVGMHF